MFRPLTLMAIGLAAGCSRPASTSPSAAVTPTPAPATAEALAAQTMAQRYFDLLRRGDDAGALKLWSADSAAVAGGVKAFAAANRAQARLEGKAGDPSAIRESDGQRYVLVESTARAVSPKGKASNLSGVVMLKRPLAGDAAWRIWGIDLRPRRCKQGQVARGLGCIAA